MYKDIEEAKSNSARTFGLIREVCNTLVPGLRLTVDLPEMHTSGKCPMLDLQVWVEEVDGVS